MRFALDLLRQSRLTPASLQAELRRERRRDKEERWHRAKKPRTKEQRPLRPLISQDVTVVTSKYEPPYHRGAAAKRLGETGDRGAINPLTAALKDADTVVRGSAADALGRIGDRSAVPALSEALKDKESKKEKKEGT